MDWSHVRVLLAVAESGGLGRAAVTLWVSEATGRRRADAPAAGQLPLRFAGIRQGLGASLMPAFWADPDPALAGLDTPPAELVEDVDLLVHADLRELPQVRGAARALINLLHGPANLLAGRGQAASRSSATAG